MRWELSWRRRGPRSSECPVSDTVPTHAETSSKPQVRGLLNTHTHTRTHPFNPFYTGVFLKFEKSKVRILEHCTQQLTLVESTKQCIMVINLLLTELAN